MKRYGFVIALLSILAAVSWAQSDAPTTLNFGFEADSQSTTVENSIFYSLSIRPYLNVGRISAALELPVRMDDQGDFIEQEWTSPVAIISKLHYLKWSAPGDLLYFALGEIDDFTLGTGFIMNQYSNMVNYPFVNKTGVNVEINPNPERIPFGGELMIDNLFDPDVFGMRAYLRAILPNLIFGTTFVVDSDPSNPLPPNEDPYAYADNPDVGPLFFWGLDAAMELGDQEAQLYITPTFDFAYIFGNGGGLGVGATGGFDFFYGGYQLRYLGSGFIPEFFDEEYDQQRRAVGSTPGKYELLQQITAGYGAYYALLGLNIADQFTAELSWEDTYTDSEQPSLFQAGFGVVGDRYFDAEIIYEKEDYWSTEADRADLLGSLFRWDLGQSRLQVDLNVYVPSTTITFQFLRSAREYLGELRHYYELGMSVDTTLQQ